MTIRISRSLLSHICKADQVSMARGFPWYIHTPQGDHWWAPDYRTATGIANKAAREAQIEELA